MTAMRLLCEIETWLSGRYTLYVPKGHQSEYSVCAWLF